MILTLLRHGRTEWNDAGRMQGRADVPLSAAGRAQVRAWRLRLDTDATVRWVASPLRRAVETAEILSGRPPPVEDALIEMDWGEWEGYTLAELRERFGEAFARNEAAGLDFRPPGGESPRDVQRRVQSWMVQVASDPWPIVAVTHKGILRAVLAAATGWDMLGKAPIRLCEDALHRFAVERDGSVSVVACNVSLLAERV